MNPFVESKIFVNPVRKWWDDLKVSSTEGFVPFSDESKLCIRMGTRMDGSVAMRLQKAVKKTKRKVKIFTKLPFQMFYGEGNAFNMIYICVQKYLKNHTKQRSRTI